LLVITHYLRLLDYIKPDTVHVLAAGRIITSGGKELALQLEKDGYAPILAAAGLEGIVTDEAPAGEANDELAGTPTVGAVR